MTHTPPQCDLVEAFLQRRRDLDSDPLAQMEHEAELDVIAESDPDLVAVILWALSRSDLGHDRVIAAIMVELVMRARPQQAQDIACHLLSRPDEARYEMYKTLDLAGDKRLVTKRWLAELAKSLCTQKGCFPAC
jgi:hypothetical protein